ncbi:MAG: hypothetical protein AB1697_09465 [Pseudomonadota bacterium]
MPIRPENRSRYPANWPEIRERIRTRSGNRCEWCGVPNGAVGYRRADGDFLFMPRALREAGYKAGDTVACNDGTSLKIIRIVLTVAHVHDHRPEACDDDNLAHLCQRCHLRHDVEHHKQTAYATRRARLAVGDLFETVSTPPQ